MDNSLSYIWLQFPLISLISAVILVWIYMYFVRYWNHWVMLKYDSILRKVYKRNTLKYTLFQWSVIILLLWYSIALGIPYQSNTTKQIQREWNDIIFVFDVSYSMIATDISPTRIDAARDMFLELTRELWNNRLWLVLYAGQAFQSVPLSFDTYFMLQTIRDINVESLPQLRIKALAWTAIGDGLLMARQSFDLRDEIRERIIILMADGEENTWVASKAVISLLQEDKVKTYTIGFWKDDNTTIEYRNSEWKLVKDTVSWIDEALLQEIARETGWEYFRATNEWTIAEIISSLSQLSTWVIETEVFQKKRILLTELIVILLALQLWVLSFYFTQNIRY